MHLNDAHDIELRDARDYENAVEIVVSHNSYQATVVALNDKDFATLVARGLGRLGIGPEVFNLESWLESKSTVDVPHPPAWPNYIDRNDGENF